MVHGNVLIEDLMQIIPYEEDSADSKHEADGCRKLYGAVIERAILDYLAYYHLKDVTISDRRQYGERADAPAVIFKQVESFFFGEDLECLDNILDIIAENPEPLKKRILDYLKTQSQAGRVQRKVNFRNQV